MTARNGKQKEKEHKQTTGDEHVERSVITNVDRDELSRSPLVRAFMLRVIDSLRDPLTGAVFVTSLADSAATAFDLHLDDGALPSSLLDIAARVIALENACRRAAR